MHRHRENAYIIRRARRLAAAVDGTRIAMRDLRRGIFIAVFVPLASGGHAPCCSRKSRTSSFRYWCLVDRIEIRAAHLKHVKARRQVSLLERWQQGLPMARAGHPVAVRAPARTRLRSHLTLALFVAVLLVFAALIRRVTRFCFFPRVEGETARANLVMPVGTPFATTDAHIERTHRGRGDRRRLPRSRWPAPVTDPRHQRRGRGRAAVSPTSGGSSSSPGARTAQRWRRHRRKDEIGGHVGLLPGAEELSFRVEVGAPVRPSTCS